MRTARARQTAVGVLLVTLGSVGDLAAQTMERVSFFSDSIAEKEDHVLRLNGGSSWLLASRTPASPTVDVTVVMRDVMVSGQSVRAAWVYVGGEEIPAKHVEGVYPTLPGYLTRVVGAEQQSLTLKLADGTQVAVPQYDRHVVDRWIPPYKALLTADRVYLYNLKEGRRVWLQAAKPADPPRRTGNRPN